MSSATSAFEHQQPNTPPQTIDKSHQVQLSETRSSVMTPSIYSSSAATCYYHSIPSSMNAAPLYATQNVVSPPLTPAVSPSSFVLDASQLNQQQQQRKYSVDVGSFGYSNYQQSMDDSCNYHRLSSCSALLPTADQSGNNQLQQQQRFRPQTTTMDFTVLLGSDSAEEIIASSLPAAVNDEDKINSGRDSSKAGSSNALVATTVASAAAKGHKHVCKYAFCGWSFKRYEHLKRHMLVHTGERPHVCQFPGCGKSFSRSDNFHAHCRTHTKKSMSLVSFSSTSSSSSSSSSSFSFSSQNLQRKTPKQKSASTGLSPPIQHQYQQGSGGDGQNIEAYTAAIPLPASASSYESIHHMTHSNDDLLFSTSSLLTHNAPTSQTLFNHHNQQQTEASSVFAYPHHPSQYYSQYTINAPTTGAPNGSSASQCPAVAAAAAAVAAAAIVSAAASSSSSPNGPANALTSKSTRIAKAFPYISQRRAPNNKCNGSSTNDQHKSHMCPVMQCQRRFKRLEHLKRHMRIHTLERPFACTYPSCHKSFSRSDNLSQHMKTHQRHEDRLRQQQQQQHHHYFNPISSSVDNC